MKKISVKAVETAALGLGVAYLDAVRAVSTVRKGFFILSDSAYCRIRELFRRSTACGNCGAVDHSTAACPIPLNFDPADFMTDSKGGDGCSCA